MAQQTINVGAAPNDGTGTPLRTAFQYTNSNFTELYTAVGPSGNNIVVPGTATITGDLTVDTSTLKVDSANNRVGIGTASPATTLDVVSTAARPVGISNNLSSVYVSWKDGTDFTGYVGSGANAFTGLARTDFGVNAVTSLILASADVERYRISSTGIATWSNVGGVAGTAMTLNATVLAIGVTPAPWATIKALQVGDGASLFGFTATEATLSGNTYYNGGFKYVGNGQASQYQQQIGEHRWFSAVNNTSGAGAAIAFGNAKMTLDASGNLLVGTTASGGQNGFCVLRPLSAGVVATTTETAHNFGALTGTTYATFLYATTAIGSITQDGTTGVLYNITSDYRLKESVKPISGGLARVNALKPSVYNWKSDGSAGEGFLAHELAEVVPFAVSGEKDAVSEDGKIKPQGIDMSRVVPILVAAIQELTARVQTLEAR